jgi:hypothetical protein
VLIMANDKVHVFDNGRSGHATSNIMPISYREKYADARYDPLPSHVVISGNRHGRAGFAPQLPGGEQLAAAFGGSIPPILWDGTGNPANLRAADGVPLLGMGLTLGAPVETAKPAPAELNGAAAAQPAAIVLPAAMEAAAR